MKRILFLSFAYPYGHYGPSDSCTVRIMDALSKDNAYHVYNISCSPTPAGSNPNYRIIPNVELLKLPFPEKQIKYSYAIEHLLLFCKIPIYPLYSLIRIWKYYKACKQILEREEHFDLVVAQCSPQWSVISAVLLKKNHYIEKLLVIFWDNIYGKKPHRVIPKWFALSRQRLVENWVAKYADKLVSPTPVEEFHSQYGDVREAKGKRLYLEHPLISRPAIQSKLTHNSIQKGMINVVYAGRLYNINHLRYVIELLNTSSIAKHINLILFFFKEPTEVEKAKIGASFKGNIIFSGFVPPDELFSIYKESSLFLGFSGVSPAQVISKMYDYMCFGKPILYFYTDSKDVNITAFARYPLFAAIDLRHSLVDNHAFLEEFITDNITKSVDYDDVEHLFPTATSSSYINLISQMAKS